MKLYTEMKSLMADIIEAEETTAAWKKEVAKRKSDLMMVIRTARKIDPEVAAVEVHDLIAQLRDDVLGVQEEIQEPADLPEVPAE